MSLKPKPFSNLPLLVFLTMVHFLVFTLLSVNFFIFWVRVFVFLCSVEIKVIRYSQIAIFILEKKKVWLE